MRRRHQRIACFLRLMQNAHLDSSAYADPPRAARQFRNRCLARCAKHIAHAELGRQIEFLPNERLVLAQRPVPTKRNTLLLDAQTADFPLCRAVDDLGVRDKLFFRSFKRIEPNAQQRTQGHPSVRRRAFRFLNGGVRVDAHVRPQPLDRYGMLKIAGCLHRPDACQIALRIQGLKTDLPAQDCFAFPRLNTLHMRLRLYVQHRHRVAHAPRKRRLAFNANLFLLRRNQPLKAQRFSGYLQFHASSLLGLSAFQLYAVHA